MEAIQYYEHDIMDAIKNIIQTQKEELIYIIPQKTIALVGYGQYVSNEVLATNNVTRLELNNEGGIIVSEVGSLGIGYFSKDTKNKFNLEFANLLRDYLQERGVNIYFDGNDLLIDGIYKCASYSSRRFGDILFSAFHISYDVDLDLINKICTKPMRKIPRGLKEYGITAEEIKQFFLNNYEKILK